MKYVPTLSILGAYTTLASNPLTPGPYTASNPGGIADPHMHVFPESDKPDRVYVYATHDEIHANEVMIWSTGKKKQRCPPYPGKTQIVIAEIGQQIASIGTDTIIGMFP